MAEPKRIAVTQIGTVKPVEKKDKRQLCQRFTLCLVRSNEKTCPEFSYNDLLKNTVVEEDVSGDEKDPFAQQDATEENKLQALAKSFEEKYAPVKQKKKHKYNRIQEFVDLGDGYDDADPFIDNTEAYDELVPSCLTTQHGGFYINSGKLDFRAVSDSEDDFLLLTKKRHKKNIVTDNEMESMPKKRGPKKKIKDEDDIRKKKRKKLSSSDGLDKPILKRKKFERDGFRGLKLKKRKRLNNVTELLNMSSSTPSDTMPGVINGSQVDVTEKEDGKILSATILQNMESTIDSVITKSRMMGSISSNEDSHDASSPTPRPSQDLNEEVKTKLPEHLPLHIYQLIANLKQAACDSEMGKKKFFTPKVNQMLLHVENGSRQLPCGVRTAIYSHLAAYLPCSKETLIKRAKKLRLDQNDDKLREPIAKLKEVINKSMPALIDKHQAELQAVQQMKRERKLELRENGSTESDEESEKPDSDKQKRIMAPRRKFEWTPDVRNLLNQIVQIKLNHYELSKIRSQTPEDYLKTFFEHDLKHLWPQGWMQSRMLFKESRAVHQRWTNPGYKPRRTLTMVTGMGMSAPVSTNGKPASPVGINASVLSNLTSGVTGSGASTTLVPSVQKKSGLLSSGGSSDSSCSSGDSPAKANVDYSATMAVVKKASPTSSSQSPLKSEIQISKSFMSEAPTNLLSGGFESTVLQDAKTVSVPKQTSVPHKGIEASTSSFMEKICQFTSNSQAVPSTSKSLLAETATAMHLSHLTSHHQTGVRQTVAEENFKSRASSTSQKTDSSVDHSRGAETVMVDKRKHHEPFGHSIKTASKQHLAAALQGMYLPSVVPSGQKSIHQSSHSYTAVSQDSHVPLKDTSHSHKSAANHGQKQTTGNSFSNNSSKTSSNINSLTSAKCQVKLSDILLSNKKSQSKQQVNYQGSSSTVTSQHRTSSSSQVWISTECRSQKQVGSVSSPMPTAKSPQTGSVGKKFQISPTDMTMIKAGLAQAATQMVLKAQEKQISSSGPNQSDQLTNQMISKGTSPVGQQANPSALRKNSPISQQNTSMQQPQKGAITSQSKRTSPVVQTGSSAQSAEKLKVAAPKMLGRLTSVIPRGHSVEDLLSPAAHSTGTEVGLFAVPGMPVGTSTRTVAVNQVSSTSGAGASHSLQSPSQTISKATVPVQVTSLSQDTSNSEQKKQASQTSDSAHPVLQSSTSRHTCTAHTVPVSRSSTSPVYATQHPSSVSLTSFRQTSCQSNNSHVTSSSHGTTSRSSAPSLPVSQCNISSQATVSRTSTSQYISVSKQHFSSTVNSHVSKPAVSSQMQQVQTSSSGHLTQSQAAHGAHAQQSQPTISGRAQQSYPTASSHTQQSQGSGHSFMQHSPATVSLRVQQSHPTISSSSLVPNHPGLSYRQKLSLHSRPDSTSASKSSEPKFGGLTLSQIQAQTLKASQKAHVPTAQQYSPQPPSTSPVYRSADGCTVYGAAQLTGCGYGSPGQSSPSLPGYSNITPPSMNHHKSPDPAHSANSPYSMLRTPPSLSLHNTSPAHKSSQNRY